MAEGARHVGSSAVIFASPAQEDHGGLANVGALTLVQLLGGLDCIIARLSIAEFLVTGPV